jgi:hypothetical protein
VASALREDVGQLSRTNGGSAEPRVAALEASHASLRRSFEEWTQQNGKELRQLDERVALAAGACGDRCSELDAAVRSVHESTFGCLAEALETLQLEALEEGCGAGATLRKGERTFLCAPMVRRGEDVYLRRRRIDAAGDAKEELCPIRLAGRMVVSLAVAPASGECSEAVADEAATAAVANQAAAADAAAADAAAEADAPTTSSD